MGASNYAYPYPKDGRKSVFHKTRSGNKSAYVVAISKPKLTTTTTLAVT